VNNNNPNREYDIKDLICGAHVNNYGVAGITDCKTHGKEFIEYKCKFCCNIASWFCWGNTHFCEDCHARQCKGDYVSKLAKKDLPKCTGKNNCPLKLDHPENGDEFALGCSLCRNEVANMKSF
jgi:E3 ubiquitin-protein ligase MYCBP2